MLPRADEDNDDVIKASRYTTFLVFFQVSSITISTVELRKVGHRNIKIDTMLLSKSIII